jgi:hypothetical protein
MADNDPTPDQARQRARRASRDISARAVPCFDIRWTGKVAGDCDVYDPFTPRLWAPRGNP